MKTETIQVTPAMARAWLQANDMNRPVRRSHVENLRVSFLRGEYVQTHQGIAIGADGHLLDGQHRLMAIAQLPDDMSFPMLVTRGLDRSAAFPVVDVVQAKRSTSDVLGIHRCTGQVANLLAKIAHGSNVGITPVFVKPFADYIGAELSDLMAYCGSERKTWSSVPVKAAAVLSMKDGNTDYTKAVYRAMVLADFDVMPPVARALFKSHLSGSIAATAAYDLLVRAIKLFDPKSANLTKVQVNDSAGAIADVRVRLEVDVLDAVGQKKATAVKRVANGVYSGKFSA